jgi:hypothetical protein
MNMMRRSRGRGGNGGMNGGSNNGGGHSSHSSHSGHSGGGRRQGGGAPNRHQSYDSNGPEVRIRGTAWQVYEKYQALARDAQAAGDRVKAENLLQHAEHYYRIILEVQEATGESMMPRQQRQSNGELIDGDEGEGSSENVTLEVVNTSQAAQAPTDLADAPQPEIEDLSLPASITGGRAAVA